MELHFSVRFASELSLHSLHTSVLPGYTPGPYFVVYHTSKSKKLWESQILVLRPRDGKNRIIHFIRLPLPEMDTMSIVPQVQMGKLRHRS